MTYIDSNEGLDDCVEALRASNEFAIDLEFDKNHYRYGFNLCLIQVCVNGACFIIDPLVMGIETSKLFPVLEDPKIQKIAYVFGEDLRLLHTLGCAPQNIFDLSVATNLLNYAPASMAAMLQEIVGVAISKSSQKSNWWNRPLTSAQLEYAASDVLHLSKLKAEICEQAAERGITDWIDEENKVFDSFTYDGSSETEYIKEKDKRGLTEYQWFLFKELMTLREDIAKQTGRPRYQIMRNELIREIVEDRSLLNDWAERTDIHKSLRTDKFKATLNGLIEKVDEEAMAQDISRSRKASMRPPNEQYRTSRDERKRRDAIKERCFKPIQKMIAEKYGEFAAPYILGNRLVMDLINGNTDQLRNYKKQIILECAAVAGVDVEEFLET